MSSVRPGRGDHDGWAADIERLARDTTVYCKLSGLLTQAAPRAGAYSAWLEIARTLLNVYAAGSEQAVFRENAVRFYNLDEPEQGQFTPPTARAS